MSSQEQRINSLLDRLRQEEPGSRNLAMAGQQIGPRNNGESPPTNRRPSLQLGLNNGSTRRRPENLSFSARTPANDSNLETERRLKEIMKISGNLTINDRTYATDIRDMDHLEVLGNGTCGCVFKMRHRPSDEIIAVKQMRRSGNSEENKRIIMDIEVVLKSHDCKYIVECLGCFITDSEVWICMELMTTCFDKLLKRLGKPIPEEILGKVTVATVEALSYLKDKHTVIHRDVKPSNILLDTRGFIKLCDFGISGRLVDSMAKSRSAGCSAYLAPERIEPDPKNPDYDIRADVWSLGITLVELATGVFPYPDCNTDFEVLTKVIGQDPPSLPESFSPEFREFVRYCLIKDQKQRPKYAKLKSLAFYKKYETKSVNVGEWVINAIQQADSGGGGGGGNSGGGAVVTANKTAPRPPSSESAFRRFFSSSSRQQQPQPKLPPPLSIAPTPAPPLNLKQHFPNPQFPLANNNNGNVAQCQYRLLKNNSATLEKGIADDDDYNVIRDDRQNSVVVELPSIAGSGHNSRLSTFQRNGLSNASTTSSTRAQPGLQLGARPCETLGSSSVDSSKLANFRTYSPLPTYQSHEQEHQRNSFFSADNCCSSTNNRGLETSKSPPRLSSSSSSSPPPSAHPGLVLSSSNVLNHRNFPIPAASPPQNNLHNQHGHRRVSSETRWRSPSASPLPLRRNHNHHQFQSGACSNNSTSADQQQPYNCGNTSPIILQRFFHQQKQQQMAKEAEEYGNKRRFASYIKLQLGGDRSGRSSRNQSPDPPPRLHRTISAGEGGGSGSHSNNQSPLVMRRNFLETNTVAAPCSPSLSRRYISPTPPIPPPRRLSESSSVPGSPQHLRTTVGSNISPGLVGSSSGLGPGIARFHHYTPEPQRRLFHHHKNDTNNSSTSIS